MEKNNILNFIKSIKDCEDIVEIYIENGIKKDYIDVRYYDKNQRFKNADGIYERR